MPSSFRGGGCLFGLGCLGFCCLFSFVEDIQLFCISPVLLQSENSWPTTDVLMIVRTSSVHGMSYKERSFDISILDKQWVVYHNTHQVTDRFLK